MTGNPQLLNVLFAAGDALSILLLLLGASLIIAAVFDAAERSMKKSRNAGPQAVRRGPARGTGAGRPPAGAQAGRS